MRVFYAKFYWVQEAADIIGALVCLGYLAVWRKFDQQTEKEQVLNITQSKKDYIFLT